MFFSLAASKDSDSVDQGYSQKAADVQKQIDDVLQEEANTYMFRNQMFSYVVLLTGEYDTMQK